MPHPSHIALLVPSVDKAAARLKTLGFEPGDAEVWDGEGTKEIYVGLGKANALLLMQPHGDKQSSYSRALEKRGPGLHHLAVDVAELDTFVLSLSGSGWLLHPRSVATMAKTRTAWLARPGFPGLIEVQEAKPKEPASAFVTALELPLPPGPERLLAPLGLCGIVKNGTETKLKIGSVSVPFKDLL